jgi:hypothetical protein
MFGKRVPSSSRLARRLRAVVSLTRSFLLLEDDYEVDWELDLDEPDPYEIPDVRHPHRQRLRGRLSAPGSRRAGQPAAAPQVCLCPLPAPCRPGTDAPSRATRPRPAPTGAPSDLAPAAHDIEPPEGGPM